MATHNTRQQNGYIIDIEDGTETARLIDQDLLFTQAMGGLFPEDPDLSAVEHILDVACGPGGWATEVAFRYRDIEVVGIDLSRTMVEYARARARVRLLDNAVFEVMDIRDPLAFDPGSFELVNLRFVAGVLDRTSWPRLLAECCRVLVPDGLLRVTECECGVSNSPAAQRLGAVLSSALAAQRRTFSVDGHSIGIAHMLGKLLQDAGCIQLGQRPFVLDASFGSDLYEASRQEYEVTFALLKPYVLASGQLDAHTYETLSQELVEQQCNPNFRALTFGLTVWGRTPHLF